MDPGQSSDPSGWHPWSESTRRLDLRALVAGGPAMRRLPMEAARGVGSTCLPGGKHMQQLGQPASEAIVRRALSTAEGLLLVAGLMSMVVVLVAAFAGP
jgi:hypothetical protein